VEAIVEKSKAILIAVDYYFPVHGRSKASVSVLS